MDVKKAIGMIPILQAANPATLAALVHNAFLKNFIKGEHLFFDRDKVRYVYFLVSGAAALYKLSNKQDKKVIFICGPGSFINEELIDERPASSCCELLSDSQVLCVEIKQFIYICEQDFCLSKAIMESMSLKIRRLYRQMKNLSNNVRGDKRIASKLWKLSRDYGVQCERGVMIGIDLTITYFADLMGSKRETVSRQLKLLTDKGLVIIDTNRFIIPDCNKLKIYFDET